MLILTTVAAAACGAEPGDAARGSDARGSDAAGATAPMVAVTLPPIADIVRVVGADDVRVVTLLPPGAHPDSYEATPRVARSIATADLLVRVGGAADAWLGSFGGVRTVVLTDGMALYGRRGPGTGNPHVWLDPIIVRDALMPRITAALTELAPAAAAAFRDRAAAFADSLTALDAEIRHALDGVDGRRFVAAHPAWVYFADRYGLEQVGAVHSTPGSELGAHELADLIEATRAHDVRAVIAEPQLGRAGVDAVAAELQVRVEVADAVGGAGLEGREDYLSLMRFNARAFARALGGGA